MERVNKVVSILFVAALVIWSTPTPSHAYLDAGSGSMMIQLLLAGTAGFAVLAKIVWQQVMDRCKLLLQKIND